MKSGLHALDPRLSGGEAECQSQVGEEQVELLSRDRHRAGSGQLFHQLRRRFTLFGGRRGGGRSGKVLSVVTSHTLQMSDTRTQSRWNMHSRTPVRNEFRTTAFYQRQSPKPICRRVPNEWFAERWRWPLDDDDVDDDDDAYLRRMRKFYWAWLNLRKRARERETNEGDKKER